MKRFLAVFAALCVLGGVAFVSLARSEKPADGVAAEAKFQVEIDAKKNPWTSLKPNISADQMQFAIVADRTGGHRKGIFSRAVQQVNLLQPEFVMSVGDLVEGSRNAADLRKQWDEFDGYAKQFKMPFFYCPGNHDADSSAKQDVWVERLGRRYYHFTYKNALFVIVNDMDYEADDAKDPPKQIRGLRVGKRQNEYLAEALKANPNVRWTFLFTHHPIWAETDLKTNGFEAVEESLKGRPYTFFCGHVHTYRKYIRNGRNYYQLATTGGSSGLREIEYGEFDQIGWVTLGEGDPILANILLGGVLKDDLRPYPTEETGGEINRETIPSLGGSVTLNGKPGANLEITLTQYFTDDLDAFPTVLIARTDAEGRFAIYGSRVGAGLRAGTYTVTVEPAPALITDPKAEKTPNPVPAIYRKMKTTPLSVTIKPGEVNRIELKLVD